MHTRKEYKLEVKIGIQEYEVTYMDQCGTYLTFDELREDAETGEYYYLNQSGERFPARRQEQWVNNGRLSVEETRMLGTMNFLGVMGVLGEMHKSIEKIGQE